MAKECGGILIIFIASRQCSFSHSGLHPGQIWGVGDRSPGPPPYSSDLAPCDFALFPKLKEDLRGCRFQNLNALKQEARRLLRNYPEEFYTQCFSDLVKRWKMCVAVGGDYFEGTHVAVPPEDFGEGETSSDSSEEE